MTQKNHTVIVVGGPAGTGKTTIGELLAKLYECPFIEGDQLHPQANIDKMSSGIPLTDDDRWGWLKQLSEEASTTALSAQNSAHRAVISCSILKKTYRDYIKKVAEEQQSGQAIQFRFVFLYTTFEELLNRVGQRKGHFMKSDMVKGQYEIMQIPEGLELVSNGGEAVSIDTSDKTPEAIFEEVVAHLRLE